MCVFAYLIYLVVATTSVVISCHKIQNGNILVPTNPGPRGKMAVKTEREGDALMIMLHICAYVCICEYNPQRIFCKTKNVAQMYNIVSAGVFLPANQPNSWQKFLLANTKTDL